MIFVQMLLLIFMPGVKEFANAEKADCSRAGRVYTWLTHMQQPNGLVLSSEQGKNISLYDNALAAIVYTAHGDFKRAEKIFNFFNSRLKSEMLVSPGGFAQMRNLKGTAVDNRPRRWLGDNAWLLIALNNYHHYAKNTRYHKLAKVMTSWIVSLQDTDGGVWGGYDADGKRISKIAEGNIDAFNAVKGYTSFHQKLLAHFKQVRWDTKDELLIAWADNPPYKYAMDLHPWGYCAFEDFPQDVLVKADRYLNTRLSTVTKMPVTGYCFDEDKDVVWLEGTAQMAVAFLKAGKGEMAQKYLREMDKCMIESLHYPGSIGLPYTTNFASSYADDVLWEGVDTCPAVSSTAWYLLATIQFDPFRLEYRKNIPEADKFWKKGSAEAGKK
ncbi:MAG: hypothetical protein ACM3PR_12955 [Bacteroidales bacterium]